MKRTNEEWSKLFSSCVEGDGTIDTSNQIINFAKLIRQEALDEAAELTLKTSTLISYEWLANKIRNLNEK